MAASAFTGRDRRRLLEGSLLLPVGLALWPQAAGGTDYASAGEALAAIDGAEAEVVLRLRRLEAEVGVAQAFARSLLRDHEAHRRERAGVRRELGLGPPSAEASPPEDALDLAALREAQEKLTYAHAEALPALGEASAVRGLARHLVDQSRHLTLLGLWIQAEEDRG
jgi:hypothetical protein